MTVVIDGTLGISPVTASGTSASVDGMTVGKGGGEVSGNVALGVSALSTNSTGNANIAIGYQALKANTTDSNVAIGYNAMLATTTGNQSIAIGQQALTSNTTGVFNTAVGYQANQANTTGGNNVSLGNSALYSNTTASNNTAVGYQSGYTNSTGTSNTFLGLQAGLSSTGNGNTLVGTWAGKQTTGTYNTFVGTGSTGYGVGELITTGSKNTIIGGYNGNQGGLDIRTASNYIVLSDGDGNPRGWWTDVGTFVLKQSSNTQTAIYCEYAGTGAFPAEFIATNASYTGPGVRSRVTAVAAGVTYNAFSYYNDSLGAYAFRVLGNGNVQNTNNSYGAISDVKLKENIVDTTPKLEDLCKVKVRQYNFKSDQTHKQIGVVAQELEEVFAGMVEEFTDRDVDGNDLGTKTKSVKYSVFVPMLIKAVQELKTIVDAQAAEIAELKAK
jgi:hypothetical protein